jgi:hypothetical protein
MKISNSMTRATSRCNPLAPTALRSYVRNASRAVNISIPVKVDLIGSLERPAPRHVLLPQGKGTHKRGTFGAQFRTKVAKVSPAGNGTNGSSRKAWDVVSKLSGTQKEGGVAPALGRTLPAIMERMTQLVSTPLRRQHNRWGVLRQECFGRSEITTWKTRTTPDAPQKPASESPAKASETFRAQSRETIAGSGSRKLG